MLCKKTRRCFGSIFCCFSRTLSRSSEDLLSQNAINAQLIQEAGLVFSCSTLGPVTPGTCFYVKGTLLQNCERFSINLTPGMGSRDIALHINPRLPQNYIVRNCKINDHWGKEEVTSPYAFCLNRGESFTIQILVTEKDYYISVNGKHFASYRHRIPYDRVSRLQVKGDVTDVDVEQLPIMQYPDRIDDQRDNWVKAVTERSEGNFDVDSTHALSTPYCARLEKNLTHGINLIIIGRVKVLPHSFFVNLQKGGSLWPHPTIAFHLNPRFADVGGHHVMCRNSWLDNKWLREERSEITSGFLPGQNFILTISCRETAYHIYLNNTFIAEYQHRIKPSVVDTVYIQGDIKLFKVFEELLTNTCDTYDAIDLVDHEDPSAD